MKVAFVGKGGSGKSTVAALFIRHLLAQNQNVLAVDADINQHLAELIGASMDQTLALAKGTSPRRIRTHLAGTNQRIVDPASMVKTTPPGTGSRLVRIDDKDEILSHFARKFSPHGYFMHVGTYDEDGIGTSCYHTSLAVLENVLSHADTADDEWIVTDMVAGTDAFAGALYLMFDVIFIVVEPTPESIGVYQQFAKLADTGGVAERVVVVGNKVIDEDDKAYIKAATGDQLVGMIAHSDTLRKQRQKGAPIDTIDEGTEVFMQQIMQQARTQQLNKNEQLKRLHELHRHFASQPFTIKKYGDLTGQIDESFKFADGAPR